MTSQPVMSPFELIAFIGSIASLILAIGAIWLSIVFYRMSTDAAKVTNEAAKGIQASVDRLEKLFDKLYSDTFSMMRDTVQDMRKHMWPEDEPEQDKVAEEAEKKADEKISDIKATMETQISTILQGQRIAEEKMQSIQKEMRHLIDRAIVSSRQVESEAREETIREHILSAYRRLRIRHPRVTVNSLINRLSEEVPFPTGAIIREINKMREDGTLKLSTTDINPDTTIMMRGRGLHESSADEKQRDT